MSINKEITTVASVALPVDENWHIRRCRYAPQGGGKGRMCIATGIHGDEMMGQLIAYDIAGRIMADPDALAGTVDIYPMLNPLGLDIAERMVPSNTRIDMNRAFPGVEDGTPLENLCSQIVRDMLGADLVLDIHASTQYKSELYEVRMNASDASTMVEEAHALCPELIWVYPNTGAFSASLTSALSEAGTKALILEADERRRRPQEIADTVVEGIFCKMGQMGLWTGKTRPLPDAPIPIVCSVEDVCRVSCERPGVYLPEDRIGRRVEAGDVLGTVIDALQGMPREQVKAPCAGLVFSQRSYSAVYPGTLIARIRKEQV